MSYPSSEFPTPQPPILAKNLDKEFIAQFDDLNHTMHDLKDEMKDINSFLKDLLVEVKDLRSDMSIKISCLDNTVTESIMTIPEEVNKNTTKKLNAATDHLQEILEELEKKFPITQREKKLAELRKQLKELQDAPAA